MSFLQPRLDTTKSPGESRRRRGELAAGKLRRRSMLGMIFGVGAVIVMLAIGEGAEGEVVVLIERLGNPERGRRGEGTSMR